MSVDDVEIVHEFVDYEQHDEQMLEEEQGPQQKLEQWQVPLQEHQVDLFHADLEFHDEGFVQEEELSE